MSEKINLSFSVYMISKITGAKYLLASFRWLCDAELFQNAYNDIMTDIENKSYYLEVEVGDSFSE